MDQSLVNRLKKNFPEMYRPDEYLGVGDGWYSILWNLSQEVIDLCRERGEVPPKVLQVKEKFGGLRFYVQGSDDFIDGIIDLAESMSYRICSECGNQSTPQKRRGWIYTLCDNCRN